MDTADRHRLAATFDSAADLYDRVRPDFADAALSWALPPDARTVLELGAGTGKLTAALVERGLHVVAVDRSPNMLARLRGRLPGVDARVGPAEHVELPDGWADVVLSGSAFHWFDRPDVEIEMHRVLRPGGTVGLLWNARDPASPLGQAFAAAQRRDDDPRPERHTDVTLDERWFGPTERGEFPHTQAMTPEDLVGLVGSRSYVIALPPPERATLLGQVREAVGRAAPGAELVEVVYRTIVLRAVALVDRAGPVGPA